MSSNNVIAIAIDGPSASGKSTVARLTARELGFLYVDSGSLYRGLTWKCLREGVNTEDPAAVAELAQRVSFEFFIEDGAVRFTLDGEDPGLQIRSLPVQERVSDVAAVPEVRARIVQLLRETTRFGNVVMEGRDIGTVVFPDTPYKFYLDADPEERARRRHKELAKQSADATVETVRESLQRRDQKDSTRKTAPLQIALGAKVIDSTGLKAEEVVRIVVERVRELMNAK